MPTLTHLVHHVRTFNRHHRAFAALLVVLFFWTVFDGIVTYVVPILITDAGFNERTLGLIIGSSSLFGALFDLLLVRLVPRASYRWYFVAMLVVSAATPVVLAQATTVAVFLLAMAVWALYFNLQTLGKFDFTGRRVPRAEHAGSFGVYDVFQSFGYILAPLLVGLVAVERGNMSSFFLMALFLALAAVAYAVFLHVDRRPPMVYPQQRPLFTEVRLWLTLGRRLARPLLLVLFLDMVTSLFWTIGPLFRDDVTAFGSLNALVVAAYELPILLVGWFVGPLTHRYGVQPVAYGSALVGSVGLAAVGLIGPALPLLAVVLLSATAFSLSLPAINGLFADVVETGHGLEPEIEAVEDFGTNLGYVIGPIVAGAAAAAWGYEAAFITVGAIGVALSLCLLSTLPLYRLRPPV